MHFNQLNYKETDMEVNKYGYLQTFDAEGIEVCYSCNRIYVNLGFGTDCCECRTRELIECEHNYDAVFDD